MYDLALKYFECFICLVLKLGTSSNRFYPSKDILRTKDTSSQPEVLLKKGVLKICSKFTWEHPCWSVISTKLQFCLDNIFWIERIYRTKRSGPAAKICWVPKEENSFVRRFFKYTLGTCLYRLIFVVFFRFCLVFKKHWMQIYEIFLRTEIRLNLGFSLRRTQLLRIFFSECLT